MTDYILRYVEGRGYLPILEKDGKEVYRGEYHSSPKLALERCFIAEREILGTEVDYENKKMCVT